jgi:DNA polymerase
MRQEAEEILKFFIQELQGIDSMFMIKNKYEILKELEKRVKRCKKCSLYKIKEKVVFGKGNIDSSLLFIGEAPGVEEDKKGIPFVGQAGKLLDKIISAMGLIRENVYITNVLKCHPPNNRDPLPNEVENCFPFLLKEIELINPKIIVTLGRHASITLFGKNFSLVKSRGEFLNFKGFKVMPTFHPAYLLRNPKAKKLVWEDMKKVMNELGKVL